MGQWYQYLLEDRVTMVKDKEGRRTARRCIVEELQPEVNWGRSFSLARLKGLSPDNKSVLLKVLHQLLPTGERVARLQPNKSPACSLCRTGPASCHKGCFSKNGSVSKLGKALNLKCVKLRS